MRSYIKKSKPDVDWESLITEFIFSKIIKKIVAHKKSIQYVLCGVLCFVLVIPAGICAKKFTATTATKQADVAFANKIFTEVSSKKGVINIPTGYVNSNPFLPYRETQKQASTGVPTIDLIDPPENVAENSEAVRIMNTSVSGILYDRYNSSALLNIEGNEFLVKKGDVINNYKVLDITKDTVTVKLGANVYTAGIGEILTEGSLNQNQVANLNNKFGGNR